MVAQIGLQVVAYYRKSPASKDAVEASIEQQQREVRAYCKSKGWNIIEEYCDGGKSGSRDQEKRTEYNRMIRDAAEGKFNAVVVWHTNRFARLDSVDIMEAVKELRTAGVHIESVRQGTIDAKTKMGRMAIFMNSETDSELSLNVSADSLRGRMTAISDGYWPHGQVPFGYDRQIYDPQGNPHEIIPRNQPSRKPIKWHVKLVINPTEAVSIRWIFDTFANTDISMRHLTREASKRGILSPSGQHHWSLRSIQEVLTNPAYAGDTTIGMRRSGGVKGKFNQAIPTRHATCPAIVLREIFDSVQQKLEQRKALGRRTHTGRAGALSGVLICGHCGHRLNKHEVKVKGSNAKVYYSCNSPSIRPSLGCRGWRAYESEILPPICSALVDGIDAEILRGIMAKPETEVGQTEALRARITDLENDFARGSDNLLLANSALFPILQKKLTELQGEITTAKNTLAVITGTESKTELQRMRDWWNQHKGKLVTVKEGTPLKMTSDKKGVFKMKVRDLMNVPPVQAKPEIVRDLLHKMNCTITLTWTPNGSRYYKLQPGKMRADFGEYLLTGDKNTTRHNVLLIHIDRMVDFAAAGVTGCPKPDHHALPPEIRKANQKAAGRRWAERNREANKLRCREYRTALKGGVA